MVMQYLHGIETVEISDGIRPIQTVKSAVIGLIGTAPEANAVDFPLDTPVRVTGPQMAARLGAAGTLKDAIDGIYDQGGATVVVVRVEEGADINASLSNVIGDATLKTGVHAFRAAQSIIHLTPRILIAPGFTSQRPQGVQTITIDAGGTGYTAATVAISAGGGIGATAEAVITGGVITAIKVTRAGTGYTGTPTVTITGDGTGAAATATVGAVANPVVAELVGIAQRLRAVIPADTGATSAAAAITWRADWGSDRVIPIDPYSLVWDTEANMPVAKPSSPRWAGQQARLDVERGFWWPASNHPINGIVGTQRPIDFGLSDPDSEANFLNENEVVAIIHRDGYRFWGVRSTATDPLWAFYSVRRTADMIYESVEQALLWAMDRPFSVNSILEIQGSVNAYLRQLRARGALLDGRAWLDPELNTPADLVAGRLTIDYDLEPPAPLERLTFRTHRNSGYYTELVEQVIAATA